jgi:hypothetical protein
MAGAWRDLKSSRLKPPTFLRMEPDYYFPKQKTPVSRLEIAPAIRIIWPLCCPHKTLRRDRAVRFIGWNGA